MYINLLEVCDTNQINFFRNYIFALQKYKYINVYVHYDNHDYNYY